MCNFIHPSEERADFYLRTGLKKPTPAKVAPPAKVVPPAKVAKGWDMSKLNAPGEGWSRVAKSSPQSKVVGEKVVRLCESVVKGVPCRHGAKCRFSHVPPKEEETVLRVPKEMFIQAMEMAMKSGKTNIRVEIIGS